LVGNTKFKQIGFVVAPCQRVVRQNLRSSQVCKDPINAALAFPSAWDQLT
jgi:hypothetical protein